MKQHLCDCCESCPVCFACSLAVVRVVRFVCKSVFKICHGRHLPLHQTETKTLWDFLAGRVWYRCLLKCSLSLSAALTLPHPLSSPPSDKQTQAKPFHWKDMMNLLSFFSLFFHGSLGGHLVSL